MKMQLTQLLLLENLVISIEYKTVVYGECSTPPLENLVISIEYKTSMYEQLLTIVLENLVISIEYKTACVV